MKTRPFTTLVLLVLGTLACLASGSLADELRNLKTGEPVPAFKLAAIDGKTVDSESFKGSVLVLVYLSAEQRSSELAAMDSRTVVTQFANEPVRLLHVTADVIEKAYFERFRQERAIDSPLGFDADRGLYGKLGLIVFPTTIVVNKEGKLAHVISIHNPDYSHILDSYIKHTLGQMDDKALAEALKVRPNGEGSPKSMASAHRAAARMMREKGRLDAAKEELNKAREQDPSNPEILLDIADLDLATNLDEAEKLVQQVLEANPDHRRAKQEKGIILYRRNQLPEAEAILLDALNLNPDPARVHYYLGRIYEQQNQSTKALEHYREALKRFLNEPEPVPAPK